MSSGDYTRTLAPPRQLYVGPVYDWSPERRRGLRGQVNPSVENRFAAAHGRFLGGVDDVPNDNMEGAEWDLDPTDDLQSLESEDDTLGSGIFDSHRHPGTANVDAGVFASNYSLPGNNARQTPFTVSRDVASLPSGADYVEVPAGGMAYIEEYGHQIWPEGHNHGVQPPQLEPPPPGGRFQTYAYMDGQMGPDGMESAAAPPGADVRRQMVRRHAPYPGPYDYPGHVALEAQPGVRQLAVQPAQRPMRYSPQLRPVPKASRVYPTQLTVPIQRGIGQEAEEPDRNWVVYGVVGLTVGAAAAVLLASIRGA